MRKETTNQVWQKICRSIRKHAVFLVCAISALGVVASTWTDPATGIEWNYKTLDDGTVQLGTIGNGAFPGRFRSVEGHLEIPSQINGLWVTKFDSGVFRWCTNLTSVTIPQKVINISASAFYGCRRLTNIEMPPSITVIGDSAFSGCEGLTSVVIPANVTRIYDCAFKNCTSLTNLTVSSCVGSHMIVGCTNLTSVTIPSTMNDIVESAFEGCDWLKSVSIPSSVVHIGENAFKGCSGLGDGVVINNGCVLTVNGDCPSEVELPEGTRLIADGAFSYSKLSSIKIPSSVRHFGQNAFEGCRGLVNITMDEGVTEIGDFAFKWCTGLTHVTIPASVTRFGKHPFDECDELESVTLSDGLTTIGENAFLRCDNLKSVAIPASVTNFGPRAFSQCRRLSSVSIDDGVPEIGQQAFEACTNLISVTIPASVRKIGDWAFRNCSNLARIRFLGDAPIVGDGVYVKCGERCSEPTVAVVSKGTTGWDDDGDGQWQGLTLKWIAPGVEIEQGMACEMTPTGWTRPLSVDNDWLIAQGIAQEGDAIEDVAVKLAATGANGIPRYESYLLGLEPESEIPASEQLKVSFDGFDADGNPVITYDPKPNNAARVKYTQLGKTSLSAAEEWTEVTDANKSGMRFYRIQAEILP